MKVLSIFLYIITFPFFHAKDIAEYSYQLNDDYLSLKFTIEKAGRKNKIAKFDVKHKDNPSYGMIEKHLIKGKTSYSGFFAGFVGQGMGWKSS